MPIARIQLEDGRVARLEVPEGTTPEQIMAFVSAPRGDAETFGAPMPPPPKPEPPTKSMPAAGLSDVIANAMTFGLTNDAAGLAKAAGPAARFVGSKIGIPGVDYQPGEVSDAYTSGRDASLNRLGAYREQNPWTAFAGDVVSGITSPASRAFLPAAGATKPATALRSAGAGAMAGALYGAGNTPGDTWDRAEGAASGGALGGVLGAVAPSVIDAAGSGLRYAADQTIGRLGSVNQQTVAARKLAEAIQREGLTPQQAAQRIIDMGQEAAIADLGPNTQALAGAVSRAPGKGRAELTDFVTARQEGTRDTANVLQGGQQGRIGAMLDDVTPARLRGTTDEIARRRVTEAAPLYEDAFSRTVDQTPRLKQFMDDPVAKRGLAKGLEIQRLEALAEGKPFNPKDLGVVDFNAAGDPILGGIPNMRTYDAVKRGLDAIIQDETNLAGKVSERGRAVLQVKNSLLNELDSANPVYAQARAAYSGPSQLLDAAKVGNSFMSKANFANADDLAAKLAKMSPDEMHAVRVGAVQALRDKMEGLVSRADATKALMDQPGMESKIRLVFGDQQTFKRYIDVLQGERQKFGTYAEVMGNSKTAARQLADADLNRDPGGKAQAIMDIASNPLSPMAYLRAGGRFLGDAKARMATPEPVRDQIARLLMQSNPEPLLENAMKSVRLHQAMHRAAQRGLLGGSVASSTEGLLAPRRQ